jgi:hypothetical protein
MNTIFNKQYHKKKFFFLIIILLLSRNSIAQQVAGPFSDIPLPPPLFSILKNSPSYDSYNIAMTSVKTFDSDVYDGILLTYNMLVNTDNEDNLHIASFFDTAYSDNHPVISIEYSNKSVSIRRIYQTNPVKYYDYKVYDKLFDDTRSYEIELYVTANFIFIVTNYLNGNHYYLTPVFFGLDIPENQIMKHFLNRANGTRIRSGDPNAYAYGNVCMYAFSYNRVSGTDSQGKKIYEGLLPNIRAWIKQLYVN